MVKRVTVLMGGRSAEREVSLVSGKACAAALERCGYAVQPIEVTHDMTALVAALTPAPDVVFNALHGRWGEDGCVQGLLNLMHIPYTHSGLLASALAMDKEMTKRIVSGAGVRCAPGRVVSKAEVLSGDVMPRPYVVKPVREGSSVGVHIVERGANKQPIEAASWGFGDDVLVEPYISGLELTVAVMGGKPLAVTEISPRQGFYDYTAKYTDGKADHYIPARVPQKALDEAMRFARLAHEALGCRGVTRSDFRFDPDQGVESGLYFLEVNTQPGMTPLSLVPEQAAYVGMAFEDLVSWMVENAQWDA
jgi:D-alanine-D-alanine ligase